MFKRIYVEISNYCNLNCNFCTTGKNTRMMSYVDFCNVCDRLVGYTKEIVLHVLGEPLVHKDLVRMVNYAALNFKVMITTNGFLLDRYFNSDFIKFDKMNISLHSTYHLSNEETYKYLDTVISFIDFAHKINKTITFNLRLWANTNQEVKKHNEVILEYLKRFYDFNYDRKNVKLKDYVIITSSEEFLWPSLKNPLYGDIGSCKGGKTHIAILADGRISICCLDSECASNLGNIFDNNLSDVLENDYYKSIIKGFNENKLVLDICKHCNYHNRKE
ncbi:MAG: radical SAM/SPASM domain-containing protein [Anaeroplasmataceae bacterium]